MTAFTSPILADSVQLIGVLLILAGAVGYLTIYYHRKFKGGTGCGCDCGIPLTRSREKKPDSAGPQQFLPAENLGDLAARHRQEQETRSRAESQPGPCCCSQRPDDRNDRTSQPPPPSP